MDAAITPMTGNETVRLLRPYDVMAMTGLSYEDAVALARVYGIKFGQRYYITLEWLKEGLEQRRRMNEQLVDGG